MHSLIIIVSILFFLIAFPAWSADYYIAQSATGANDATSCANAKAVTWDWTSPNVVEGDIIHLCGTFTSTLTIPQSFTSAVTVKFETGAKFSKAAWGTGENAAIYATNKNNIIIDGNNVGIIENTDNGDYSSGKGTDQVSNAIYITRSSNWEVKNLTIQDIYIHTYNDASSTRSVCVSAYDVNNISIHNNDLNNAYYGISASTNSENVSGINIYNNTVDACSTALVVALGNNGTSMDTVNIYNNSIAMGNNWYDEADANHIDGIHIWGRSGQPSDTITNLKIYNNIIGGNPSTHSTAMIFLEYTIPSPQIYNNVLYAITNNTADGMIYIKGNTGGTATNGKIYHNTIIGKGSGVGIELANSSGNDIENNIVYSFAYALAEQDSSSNVAASDYNVFYGIVQEKGWARGGVTKTLVEWQALGLDTHSSILEPSFADTGSHDYRLQSSDTVAKDKGVTLGASWEIDINGVKRPQGATWDIGAYEYSGLSKFYGNVCIGCGGTYN